MLHSMARVAGLGLLLGSVFGASAACRTNFEENCDKGTLACECLPEAQCVDGLGCYEGLCVQLDGETGETGDGDGEAGGEGEAGGDGDGDGENLFGDPSFESWAGMANRVWDESQASLSPETEMLVSGESSGRFVSEGYGSIGQTLGFSPPVGGGVCLRASATVAYVDGDPQAIAILMNGVNDEGEEFLAGDAPAWTANGEWQQIEAVIIPVGMVSAGTVFFSAPADPQSWLIDDARLERVPCP